MTHGFVGTASYRRKNSIIVISLRKMATPVVKWIKVTTNPPNDTQINISLV